MFDIAREKLTATYQGLKKENKAVRSNQGLNDVGGPNEVR